MSKATRRRPGTTAFPQYKFVLTGAVQHPSAFAARQAVFTSFMGPLRTEAEVLASVSAVQYRWRSQLCGLMSLGWRKGRHTLNDCAFNCLPCAVYCQPVAHCCRMEYFCPFCFGRSISYLYYSLAGILAGVLDSQPDVQMHLIAGRAVHRYTMDKNSPAGLPALLAAARLRQRALVRRIEPYGAQTRLFFEPEQNSWCLTEASLLLARDYQVPDASFSRYSRGVTMQRRVVTNPRPQELVDLLSWVFRYPDQLLRAPAKQVLQFLKARSDKHLSASYGCFRAIRPWSAELGGARSEAPELVAGPAPMTEAEVVAGPELAPLSAVAP